MTLSTQVAAKYDAVRSDLRALDNCVVAFSGGVDSSLVAFIAGQELGERAVAVTSGSRSLKRSDLALAESLARSWGLAHRVIYTDELSKPDYRANPTNRCFHCKTSLYEALSAIAQREGIGVILNGTNVDDLGDHRPGLVAADNYEVHSPLVDAGMSKADIRELAAHLGLENAQKPQSACLSSRFPYGTAIDEDKLAQVEAAEEALAAVGFTQFRVRHHGEVARLELLPAEFALAFEHHDRINAELTALGYRFVSLDLKGFRSGSMNEGLAAVDVVRIVEPAKENS
ncbi:MAG: ATP-dependent sacrificial sulfur transferase LarE [Pseudomonadota bacterium]